MTEREKDLQKNRSGKYMERKPERKQTGSQKNSRKNSRRRFVWLLAGAFVIAVGICFFACREKPLTEETGWSSDRMGDQTKPVWFTADGTRRIDWSRIRVPDWIERDLLPVNPQSRPGEYLTDVNGIVIHYTANPMSSARQNRDYFAGLAEGGDGRSVSSHFIIGIEGEIIQCVPMSEVAYASNDRNYDTISIECCHKTEDGKLTKKTYDSLVRLTAWLSETYLVPADQIIRHYDITGKICPKYFVDHEDKWEEFLSDVVRERKKEYGHSGMPSVYFLSYID